MGEHTPGPWRVEQIMQCVVTVAAGGEKPFDDWRLVVDVSLVDTEITPNEARANADLMAAAPDLLAALEMFLAKMSEVPGAWEIPAVLLDDPVAAALAAIAKAKGGAS